MSKPGSSGRHRPKAGKTRQQGANASGRKAAERAKQDKIGRERGGSTGGGKGGKPSGKQKERGT